MIGVGPVVVKALESPPLVLLSLDATQTEQRGSSEVHGPGTAKADFKVRSHAMRTLLKQTCELCCF